MITQMKKITFLVTNKEYEQFIAGIRRLGVIHIDQLQSGATSDEFEAGKVLAERYKSAFRELDYAVDSYKSETEYTAVDFSQMNRDELCRKALSQVEQVEMLVSHEQDVKRQIEATEKNIKALEPWGDIDKEQIAELEKQGYKVGFFACPTKMLKAEWADLYYATPIDERDKKTYFVTFSKEHPDITAETLELPPKTLSSYIEESEQLKEQLNGIHTNLLSINGMYREMMKAAQVEVNNDISLSRVHLSSESVADDALKLMQGWIPAEQEADVTAFLDENHIYYETENPELEDNVPVEIKNGKFSSLFEPILKMYSLPNYHDLDVTPFFAPFFMLFFGLCMGDAGYGLIILAVSILLHAKLPQEQKPYAKLGIFLGAMTIVCGTLTGSFFGIDLTQQEWAFLAPVKKYFINEHNFRLFGYSPMMVISVIIGLIQVLLGMVLAGIKAAKLHGWKFGIGKFSWVTALLSAVLLFGLPACGVALPVWLTYVFYALIGVSAIGIFFLNNPAKNPLLNIGTGVWDTYGMATGLLGDLLSYIRLFALGLTGGVLGSVFNSLAIDMTDSMPWAVRWLPMLIILLLGHGINFALCMISSFVHPMRLTFVEFFKNANFEGGGKAYEPFEVKTYKK